MIDHVLESIKTYYLEWLPFNKVLGISIDHLDYETSGAVTSFPMKPDLIGNSAAGILHGGVTAAVIDLTGGLSALLSCVKINEGASLEDIQAKLVASATIDMRVDYLRAGKGDFFTATGSVLRQGNKVAVIRTEFCNDLNLLIAAGTGTYLVG